MTRAAFVALCAGALMLAGCYGQDPNLTEAGLGRPEIGVEFPASAAPASVHSAVFTITNPGPGEMASVVLAFARIGPASPGKALPNPIVEPGARGETDSVVAIDPEPEGISLEAVVYRFGGLAEGDTLTVTFDLRVPDTAGAAANSVTAYAGEDPERARGVRLQTVVE